MAADLAPPHSLEAEQAVLGGLLLDSKAWHRVSGLTTSDFYRPDHQLIHSAIAAAGAAGRQFDVVVIGDDLERRGQLKDIGGLAYLGQIARDTPGAGNVAEYAATVRGYALRRRLQAFAADVLRVASIGADEPADMLLRAQQQLIALQSSARAGSGLVRSADLAQDFIDDLESRRTRQCGLQIGLTDFDELTGGLEPGDLDVIAARPGMGKTALLVTIAAHVAQTHQVATFSCEMPSMQLMRRTIALLGSISQSRLRRPDKLDDVDWAAIAAAATQVAARHLWIDDTALPTLAHIRAECASLKARAGLGLVMVDYVQLVKGIGNNRYEELRQVAYGLKALAKDLAVPVIALAQLNRGVESRDQKRPHASDLRDSGAIEEAADIIGLLYSEAHYNQDFGMRDVLECHIVKHRNGERGQCLWSMNGAQSRITVLDAGDCHQYRVLLKEQSMHRRRPSDDL